MSKFRNYVFTAAGLVILAGAFTVIGPYVDLGHSKPPQADETMVITIAQDLTQGGVNEFDAVDVSGFRFVTFHIKTATSPTVPQLKFRFSTQAGRFSDAIPRTFAIECNTLTLQGVECFKPGNPTRELAFPIAGPFLLVQLQDANDTTLQVFLSR